MFARSERDVLAELEFARERRQRRLAYQLGARARQRAFVGACGQRCVKRFGDHQVDQRIAEEFEALVVRCARAAMGQGLREQARIGETRGREARRTADFSQPVTASVRSWVASNLPTTSRLLMIGLRHFVVRRPCCQPLSVRCSLTFSRLHVFGIADVQASEEQVAGSCADPGCRCPVRWPVPSAR